MRHWWKKSLVAFLVISFQICAISGLEDEHLRAKRGGESIWQFLCENRVNIQIRLMTPTYLITSKYNVNLS